MPVPDNARFPVVRLMLYLACASLASCQSQPSAPAKPKSEGPAHRVHVTPPALGNDFPSPESFYPAEAREQYREGSLVVRYCTDAQGQLVGAPTVSKSSGNPDLDSAGVLLATAGSGHYIPGVRDGVPASGCNEFRVRFEIPTDPRWPSLGHRLKQLNAHLAQGMAALGAEAEHEARPRGPYPRSREELELMRQFAARCEEVRVRVTKLMSDYIAGMDELTHATDAPLVERTAFNASWGEEREGVVHFTSEMDLGSREVVAAMTELATYYDQAKPPLLTASGASTPTKAQEAQIRRFVDRGGRAAGRIKAAMEALENQAAGEIAFPNSP